jgi:hypothetical protein
VQVKSVDTAYLGKRAAEAARFCKEPVELLDAHRGQADTDTAAAAARRTGFRIGYRHNRHRDPEDREHECDLSLHGASNRL